jgi:hypothetical protein
MKGPRRFRAVRDEDKFMYMVDSKFAVREMFQRYQGSDEKKALVEDFMEHYGDCAKLRSSVWERILP